jgi:hypothetical protein
MKDSERVCVYCRIGTDLTNEHLFPECIHQRVPSGQITSIARTSKGDKAVDAPIRIRDVCRHCNNVSLSRLDTTFALCTINTSKPLCFREAFCLLVAVPSFGKLKVILAIDVEDPSIRQSMTSAISARLNSTDRYTVTESVPADLLFGVLCVKVKTNSRVLV